MSILRQKKYSDLFCLKKIMDNSKQEKHNQKSLLSILAYLKGFFGMYATEVYAQNSHN